MEEEQNTPKSDDVRNEDQQDDHMADAAKTTSRLKRVADVRREHSDDVPELPVSAAGMSEYDKQCQEMASEYDLERRAIRRAVWRHRIHVFLAVLLAVVAIYGALGYLTIWYLPAEISRKEKLRLGFEEVRQEVRKDERVLNDCLKKAGMTRAGGTEKNRKAMLRVLRDPDVIYLLRRYLGESSVLDNSDVSDKLRASSAREREIHEAEVRLKALSWDFKGINGVGSCAWRRKVTSAEDKLDDLKNGRSKLEETSQNAEARIKLKIRGLKQVIQQNLDVLQDKIDEVDQLQIWQQRLCVWPLPMIERFIKTK